MFFSYEGSGSFRCFGDLCGFVADHLIVVINCSSPVSSMRVGRAFGCLPLFGWFRVLLVWMLLVGCSARVPRPNLVLLCFFGESSFEKHVRASYACESVCALCACPCLRVYARVSYCLERICIVRDALYSVSDHISCAFVSLTLGTYG